MGGLGITSTVLKQRYFFEASLKSIDERSKPINAPVDKGGKKQADSTRTNSQAARTQLRKSMKNEHEKTAAELSAIPRFQNIIKRTKEANNHLDSTCNYVNPYLFRYTLMMRLGIALSNVSGEITCPGCGTIETSSKIIPHVAGCSRCAGMNCTRKHFSYAILPKCAPKLVFHVRSNLVFMRPFFAPNASAQFPQKRRNTILAERVELDLAQT